MQGKNQERPHKNLYWRYNNCAAIRSGDWKLIRFPDRLTRLYNLKTDVGEKSDVVMINRDIVNELLGDYLSGNAVWLIPAGIRKWNGLKKMFFGTI